MLEKHALLFVQAAGTLADAKWIAVSLNGADNLASRSQIHAAGQHGVHQLREACALSDLDNVIPELDRVSASLGRLLEQPTYTLETVVQEIKHLLSRIQDELAAQYFFHLDQRDVPFYLEEKPFGTLVSDKFDVATEDIAEAGKCLALQRPTACVFHLMRVLELGVQALGKKSKVKIDVQSQTWHQIMLHVDKTMQQLPNKTPPQRARKSDYAAAASYLQSVRLAWRNEVMHPKQTYTRQEALDIFNASKAFMISLAALV